MKNDEELAPILIETEEGEYIPFVDPEDETVDINDLLAKIAGKEVNRLDKNLDNVTDLETILIELVKTRAVNNRLDLKTLQSVIKTLNDSVKRNLSVVQGKQTNLFNVFLNADGSPVQKPEQTPEKEAESALGLSERKRVRSLMDAILATETTVKEEEE